MAETVGLAGGSRFSSGAANSTVLPPWSVVALELAHSPAPASSSTATWSAPGRAGYTFTMTSPPAGDRRPAVAPERRLQHGGRHRVADEQVDHAARRRRAALHHVERVAVEGDRPELADVELVDCRAQHPPVVVVADAARAFGSERRAARSISPPPSPSSTTRFACGRSTPRALAEVEVEARPRAVDHRDRQRPEARRRLHGDDAADVPSITWSRPRIGRVGGREHSASCRRRGRATTASLSERNRAYACSRGSRRSWSPCDS
jgi:hypothetical protein